MTSHAAPLPRADTVRQPMPRYGVAAFHGTTVRSGRAADRRQRKHHRKRRVVGEPMCPVIW